MADQSFSDLYMSECDNCGASLEYWEWSPDDLMFRCTCTCGSEITLEPTVGVINYEVDDPVDEEEDEDS